MNQWTKEQYSAIHEEGKNIMVSAGAGSGKTAVLTERVLRKIREGVSIKSLLILTFTKAAADEMKERIRKGIQKEHINVGTDLDTAYITTFDSFALSLVRKYHYLCNISKEVSIVEGSIISLKKEEFLEQLFEHRYEIEDLNFCKFISKYCTKDDIEVKKDLLQIYEKLDLQYDKKKYLDHYLEKEYKSSYFEHLVQEYFRLLLEQVKEMEQIYESLSCIVDSTYLEKIEEVLLPLFQSQTYQEIQMNCQVRIPNLPKNSDEAKPCKEELTNHLKELKRLTCYQNEEEIIMDLKETRLDTEVIISIIQELDKKLLKWKRENNLYEFGDIAKLAIQIVDKESWIREELKQQFTEILLDEYQDTSDLQEMLMGMISNNNLYMVGDMKQSIYRFRNANPKIFKEKYDAYKNELFGMKIDLQQNFRSRPEPLENINHMFNRIMQEELGGARYQEEHQMIFGNQMYITTSKTNENHHMELLSYSKMESFNKEEIEAFLIAEDIQNRIKKFYPVVDKETGLLRSIEYRDFVILLDRATAFETYRKIFEYCQIPIQIYQDETLTTGIDTRLIFHILRMMEKIEEKNDDEEFLYSFMSIERSYLIAEKDDSIFETITKKTYKETMLYQTIETLISKSKRMNNEMILEEIIQEFDFENKLITVGKIEESMIRLEYLHTLASTMSCMGYSRKEMCQFLNQIAEKNYVVRYSKNTTSSNSVNLMTIHKSKGLEYPICYYAGLSSKFNKSDLKERFTFDETLGFIIPIYQNGIRYPIKKELLRKHYNQEEISEKIRLFYVALTRAKEKIIMVLPKMEGNMYSVSKVPYVQAIQYQSFYDMLKSIAANIEPYIQNREPQTITKEYRMNKLSTIKRIELEEKLIVHPLSIPKIEKTEKILSKNTTWITKESNELMTYGEEIHHILECIDMMNPTFDWIPSNIKSKIQAFFNSGILKSDRKEVYQEYEFIYEENNEKIHGRIDCMVIYEDRIDIIDYKLKEINDKEYIKQLKGYQTYLSYMTNKKIDCYLYSILEERYQKLD